MKLTGKCKEDFEKWLNSSEKYIRINPILNVEIDLNNIYIFGLLTTSMQYGVLVDFFDSVGVYIQIETRLFDNEHPVYIYYKRNYTRVGRYKKRPEARTLAIEQANEIYNKI